MNYSVIMVEGIHDLASVQKICKIKGFHTIHELTDVPKTLIGCIPKQFPFYSNDIDKRTAPCPTFMKKDNMYLLIKHAGGQTNIIKELNAILKNIITPDLEMIKKVGIILDADDKSAKDKIKSLEDEFDSLKNDIELVFTFEDIKNGIGKVYDIQVNYSTYILPDNLNEGLLEDLLIEGAIAEYNDLLNVAQKYIDEVPPYYKVGWKPSYLKKALIGCIGNVLKPGKANQVTIHDNKWFTEESIRSIYSHRLFSEFIQELM